ncbi:MAG TPA: prepilin-type N-terminal cleavage/methylation domain-containing protein [Acidobacteriota bacterium]|nr:prepilin-type N-terminal cleavage/methylation domain-containing protein [Acidobacteriota bacterium]
MRKMKGFTLIELLIVVAIIGIIAAIAIPNLLDAIERSRQKRSVSELKTVANSLQSFSTDYGGYPNPTDVGGAGAIVQADWAGYQDADSSPAFIPDYIQAMPNGDGWNMPYNYTAALASTQMPPRLGHTVMGNFLVASMGSDRAEDGGDDNAGTYTTFETWLSDMSVASPGTLQTYCYESDIVWVNSAFQQAPEGKQKKCD